MKVIVLSNGEKREIISEDVRYFHTVDGNLKKIFYSDCEILEENPTNDSKMNLEKKPKKHSSKSVQKKAE